MQKLQGGRWKQAKNEISLLPDTRENIVLKPTIVYEADSKDSFITFHVVDNFGKPFKKYSIVFFNDEMREDEMLTNENGILQVPKNKFAAYLPVDEYNNMQIGSDLLNNVHFLWKGMSDVRVTLNYPISILRYRPNTIPSAYKGDVYRVSPKGLTSTTGRYILTRQ